MFKSSHPAKDAVTVIGAVIVKHELSVSDEEAVEQIRENPYLQYFIELKGFQAKAPFASLLLTGIRKRMGQTVFDEFHEAIIDVDSSCAATAIEADQSLADEKPQNHGRLILDATVAEQC